MKSTITRQSHVWLPLVIVATSFPAEASHASTSSTSGSISRQPTSIEITADAIDDDHLPQGATTLGKMPLKAREVPQSVSVVDKERIDHQDLRTLDDVMAQSTGVSSTPFIMSRTAYYVRGFQVNSFEMDGVPVLLSEMGGPSEDMSVYERVEVLRGANGLLHGNGNPAATINMVRKHAPYNAQTNIRLEAGSWNRYRGELDVGGPLNRDGSIRGRAIMAWEDGDYFYDRAKHRSQVVYGTLDADLSDDTTFRIGGERYTIHSNPNMGGVPMGADGQDLHLSQHTKLDGDWTYVNYYTTRFFAGIDHHFNDIWQGKVNLDYQNMETDNRYGVYYGEVDAQTGDGGGIAFTAANKYKNHHLGVDANVVGQPEAFGHTHQVIFGASLTDASVRQDTASSTSSYYYPVTNIYRWDPSGLEAPALGDYTSPGASDSLQKGVYGMGRIKLADPLTLIAGARENWWQARTPTAATSARAKLTPYGGLIWDIAPNWSWYGSYATVWQPQTYLTYDGSLLEPMKGTTWETGVKTSLNDAAMDLSLAVFKIDMQNTPMADTRHIDTTTYYVNGGDASSKGVELETNGHLTPNWTLFAGYTWVKPGEAKTLSDGVGTPFGTGAPRHMLRVWSSYDLPWDNRRWNIGGGFQAQSRSASDYDASVKQGGYLLANMRVGYRINDHWTAAINANNIFDRRYYAGLFMHQFTNHYGDPRNLSVSLTGHF